MATKKDALKEYKAKRDFSKTSEPAVRSDASINSAVNGRSRRVSKTNKLNPVRPAVPTEACRAERPDKRRRELVEGLPKGGEIFVVQKHAASHLHYDFRLEIDGVLVSWAIPKGPSLDPADKRLAVMTENHPLDYAHFEGVIPQGEYGGGTVMVWDIGTYENIKEAKGALVPMATCLKNGRIEIMLHGKKLNGAYALVRFKGKDKQWLCIKMKDEYAGAGSDIVSSKPKSSLTGRTLTQITKAGVVFSGECSSTACHSKTQEKSNGQKKRTKKHTRG